MTLDVVEGFEGVPDGATVTSSNTAFDNVVHHSSGNVLGRSDFVHSGARSCRPADGGYGYLRHPYTGLIPAPADFVQFWWMRWDDEGVTAPGYDDVWSMHFGPPGDDAGSYSNSFVLTTGASSGSAAERAFTLSNYGPTATHEFIVPRQTWTQFQVTFTAATYACRLVVGGNETTMFLPVAQQGWGLSYQEWHPCDYVFGGSNGQYHSWWDDFNFQSASGGWTLGGG